MHLTLSAQCEYKHYLRITIEKTLGNVYVRLCYEQNRRTERTLQHLKPRHSFSFHKKEITIMFHLFLQENDFVTQSSNSFSQLGAKAIKSICSISTSINSCESYNFSSEDLNKYLYGQKKVKAIDIERILRKRKLLESENLSYKRSSKYNAVSNKSGHDERMWFRFVGSPIHETKRSLS